MELRSLRNEGAKVADCLVIVSYDFTEAKEAFEKANVNLHPLTTFPVILEEVFSSWKTYQAVK
jgi:orotate phosphoribosyltransferase